MNRSNKESTIRGRFISLIDFAVKNKINFLAFLLIFAFIFYVFTYGWLAINKNVTDLSQANIECINKGKRLYFSLREGVEFFTAKKFSNCIDVAAELENRRLTAYHSSKGIIHRLIVDKKVLFSISPYLYIIPYSFLCFGLFMVVRKAIRPKQK